MAQKHPNGDVALRELLARLNPRQKRFTKLRYKTGGKYCLCINCKKKRQDAVEKV